MKFFQYLSFSLLGVAAASHAPRPVCHSTPADYDHIRNTISSYNMILDTKDYQQLKAILTDDFVANFDEPLGPVKGADALIAFADAALSRVITQHALSTQKINIESHESANATTYLTVTNFGINENKDVVVYQYGKYTDDLVKVGEEWKIKERTLAFMLPQLGNVTALFG